MTLCDTGPIVAIINARDKDHKRCVAALASLRQPLVTTWPCITEAMYLLWQFGGFQAQDALWDYLENGLISCHASSPAERIHMRALMKKYEDTPMDLADASLVAFAETLEQRQIFTLDGDFYIYRFNDKSGFDVVPSPL